MPQRLMPGARSAIASALLLIAVLTLVPQSGRGQVGGAIWCVWCGQFATLDLVMNTLLFVPLGAALVAADLTTRRAMIVVLLTTLSVELLQLQLVAGRDASLVDVATNWIGGWIGLALAARWRSLLSPSPRLAGRLAMIMSSAWILGRLATGLLLRPAPSCGPWWAQIAPHGVYPADFTGTVHAAALDDRSLARGRMPEVEGACQRMARDGLKLRASLLTGEPTAQLASVVSIGDQGGGEVALLGQHGTAARFRVRLLATDAKLRVPSVKLTHAFESAPKSPLELSGTLHAGELVLLSQPSAAAARRARLSLDAGLGWALLIPFDTSLPPSSIWITATWTMAWLTAIAYWWRARVQADTSATLQVAVVLLIGLSAPVALVHSPLPAAQEIFGALLGAGAGIRFGGWAGRVPRGAPKQSSGR